MTATPAATGIKNLDDLVARARSIGLRAEITADTSAAVLYSDGTVMVPEIASYRAEITIPVPEPLLTTGLLFYRYASIRIVYTKGARGRLRFASTYPGLGGKSTNHRKLRHIAISIETFGEDLTRLKRLATEERPS